MHAQIRPNLTLFNRKVDFAIFQSGHLHQISRAMMQISVECVHPQQHSGERPVLVYSMVLKIEVFFLITSTIASCLVEVSHLVKDIKNNSSILCAAEDLHISLISAS